LPFRFYRVLADLLKSGKTLEEAMRILDVDRWQRSYRHLVFPACFKLYRLYGLLYVLLHKRPAFALVAFLPPSPLGVQELRDWAGKWGKYLLSLETGEIRQELATNI
jgi:hypothetical protein